MKMKRKLKSILLCGLVIAGCIGSSVGVANAATGSAGPFGTMTYTLNRSNSDSTQCVIGTTKISNPQSNAYVRTYIEIQNSSGSTITTTTAVSEYGGNYAEAVYSTPRGSSKAAFCTHEVRGSVSYVKYTSISF